MQKVIAARDVDLYLTLPNMVMLKVLTASDFSATISGNTEDIGAISTDEPIAVDNSGNTYDLSFSLQSAEALAIKDALAAATAAEASGSIAHIRQIVETATITVVWRKRRDVPATATTETYSNCTGVEESDGVQRRSPETIKTWRFRARGLTRVTVLSGGLTRVNVLS